VKEDLHPHMLEGMQIHFVHTVDEALELALSKPAPVAAALKKGQLPPVGPAPVVPPIH